MLADFETPADRIFEKMPNVTIVAKHQKSGTHALQVSHPPNTGESYWGISIDSPAYLNPIRESARALPLLCLDIYNPQPFPVPYGVGVSDARSVSYGTRYNDDGLLAPPGWSTFRLNLTGMTRSSSANFSTREPLDLTTIKRVNITTFAHKQPVPVILYFDCLRLEGTGLPAVDGLQAFDFGPSKSAVFPGFQGVNENTIYDASRGFGWRHPLPSWHRRAGPPDDLGGDYGSGDAFRVDLKSGPGTYVVAMCIDRFDEWGSPQVYTRRTVTLNGKIVHDEHMDGATFLNTQYLRYEFEEDTPGMDIWERRVKPALPLRVFEAEVNANGTLDIRVATEGKTPGIISFAVVYPKAREIAGRAFLDALEKRRKEMYADSFRLAVPPPDNGPCQPTAQEQAHGYVTFARSIDADIACAATPAAHERGAPLVLSACPGQREAIQLGLLPLARIEGVKITATVSWERLAAGITDYRMLKTIRSRIAAVRKNGGRAEVIAAAESFLAEMRKPIRSGDAASGETTAEAWAQFRADAAKQLAALSIQ